MAGRSEGQFRKFGIARKLNADLLRISDPRETTIDTSTRSPATVAETIVSKVKGQGSAGGYWPPVSVFRMTPPLPTTHPTEASTKATPLKPA
jgi:hypothetical protein